MFCFEFVKEWAKSRKKSHISSKLYGFLFTTFSATRLEFLSWNLRNCRILQKDRWTEVIEFCKNFAWYRANTCDIVCKENLKHFHTSLLSNEEDAKGLLNIKQEFLLQWFHLKRGDLVMNGYRPCWLLRTSKRWLATIL